MITCLKIFCGMCLAVWTHFFGLLYILLAYVAVGFKVVGALPLGRLTSGLPFRLPVGSNFGLFWHNYHPKCAATMS